MNGADGRVESEPGCRSMAARRKSRRRRQRARQTQETRPMGNGWKRNDAMRCDATRTPHGARSPNVVRLSAPVSAAKQPGRAAPQRPLIQPHSGHPVGGPALGARGQRDRGPGRTGDKGGVPIRGLGTGGVGRRNDPNDWGTGASRLHHQMFKMARSPPPPLLPRPQGDHNTAAIRHGH